ncbi:Heat shock protein 12B [Araneus ventricosus]|uniref:Heat shock protein 12B n=1 Tax=Araneus ventricosus TaxID=182803 RepID=A0A4Y2VTV4_ARAVE|nr:Heat shock protein 12B [Araneus ventricosus]
MHLFLHSTRYMVVDCGGGTVDITVTKSQTGGTIKELAQGHRRALRIGGDRSRFESFWPDIFGTDFIEHFKTNFPQLSWTSWVAFRARKRNASPFKITPINIALPFSFVHHYKEDEKQYGE